MPSSAIFPDWVHAHDKHEKTKPQEVPKHRPKARPPRGIRDRIPLYGKLPRYTGPYQVGTIDLEVPAKEPRTFSDITRQQVHIIALETVLMTIYYPAHIDSRSHVEKSSILQTFRPTWLTRPRDQTSRGYARFASLPEHVTLAWFLCTTWFTKLPAYKNARIAEHWPQHGAARENHRNRERYMGNPPPGGPEKPKFPLMLFSHGLGGTRTAYSSVCGEFASHGFVVVALEHRDGSGPRTLINHPENSPASRECVEKRGNIEHFKSSKGKPYDVVDFIFPKYDKNDTTPGHEVDKELRRAQVDLRLAEIHEAYQVMQEICAGDGDKVAARNLRLKGAIGASKRGLEGIDWSTWKDRFHTQGVTMVGHSFGAVTTVSLLRQKERFKYITQGIVYDIWGMAVLDPPDAEKYRLHVPLLGINSEAFMYWRENLDVATSVIQEALDEGQPAWLMTVRGTVHISQSDFCILYPHVASLVMKMTIDPVRAIDLNIDASLDFLSRVMPEQIRNEQPFMRTLGQKRLLDLEVIHNVPEEHQPDPKYTAIKLKVKHEARKRLVPGSRKKYWERLEKSREEVWLHLSPDCAKIGRCQTCADRRTGFAELKSSTPEDEEGGEWENVEDEPNAMSTPTGS